MNLRKSKWTNTRVGNLLLCLETPKTMKELETLMGLGAHSIMAILKQARLTNTIYTVMSGKETKYEIRELVGGI